MVWRCCATLEMHPNQKAIRQHQGHWAVCLTSRWCFHFWGLHCEEGAEGLGRRESYTCLGDLLDGDGSRARTNCTLLCKLAEVRVCSFCRYSFGCLLDDRRHGASCPLSRDLRLTCLGTLTFAIQEILTTGFTFKHCAMSLEICMKRTIPNLQRISKCDRLWEGSFW